MATELTGRDLIVQFLRRHLEGPLEGDDEVVPDAPSYMYTCGVLFPQGATTEIVLEEDIDDDDAGSGDLADDPVQFANQQLPASVGVSFHLVAPLVRCEVRAAAYEKTVGGWARRSLATDDDPAVVTLGLDESGAVFHGAATVRTKWRPFGGGWIVTVAVVNEHTREQVSIHEAADCLFQVGLRCAAVEGEIRVYPEVDRLIMDDEAEELALLYRDNRTYAVGHGCAAEWAETEQETASWVAAQFIPAVEVPGVVPTGSNAPVLRLERLARCDDVVLAELDVFVDTYQTWVNDTAMRAQALPERYAGAITRVLARLHTAVTRMRAGVSVLREEVIARDAFRDANLAMLMQMRHSRKDLAGQSHDVGDPVLPEPSEYAALDSSWHPFQLGFLLLSIPGLVHLDDPYRHSVDLIWFPTGGGKTEAYLSVAAFQILFRRRQAGPAGGGTTVITRYTLRLLTAQQFQRTATLVCALEWLNRKSGHLYGKEAITIGLWIGEDTPDTYEKAYERAEAMFEEDIPANRFQLAVCPWCGTSLVPPRRRPKDHYGIRSGLDHFEFYCPTQTCEFHDGIPVQVVDRALYSQPPTILIGTVDKFARLAWVEEAGAFFGKDGVLPPSLIIQDELHLLSGPLGTTVGIYETAIEALCELRGGSPKFIASTATIREAGSQAVGLFGREVRLFPPAGIEANESYFAHVDVTRAGRLYMGVLAPSHTPSTSLVRTCAVLAEAAVELDLSPKDLDGYWTQVVYHNSLRELGKTVTFARDDIPAWISVIATVAEERVRQLRDDDVLELTGNVPSHEIPLALARLSVAHPARDCVSLVACTNMLSVGVDVPRLALMVVNGQPKTTSEYIQASSRVGRSAVPGLVLAHYAATKPHDRSHYEYFTPYHRALYRHVEPTSVTPFAVPARQRALHAALVIVVRHGAGLNKNADAGRFRVNDPAVQRAVGALVARIKAADPTEAGPTESQLRRLMSEWEEQAMLGAEERHELHYQAHPPLRRLLRNFEQPPPGWPTLNSMRSVDRESRLKVLKGRAT